jgi:hypothetical protein
MLVKQVPGRGCISWATGTEVGLGVNLASHAPERAAARGPRAPSRPYAVRDPGFRPGGARAATSPLSYSNGVRHKWRRERRETL